MEFDENSVMFERPVEGLKRLFSILASVLLVLGSYGLFQRMFRGHLNANYGSVVTWGLWVATYIYFIGLSAGAFLISSLVYVFNVRRFERVGRLAVLTALITLFLALLSIVFDLGHMERSWHVMAYPNFKSPMAWMIWLYSAYSLILLGEFWFLLRRDLVLEGSRPGLRGRLYRVLALGSRDTSKAGAQRDRKIVRALATVGVPLAVMFHGGVGALFGVVSARPHWHSGLFPILFLLSALVSGGSLLAVAGFIFQKGWKDNSDTVVALGRLVLGLLLLDVLFQTSEFLVAFRGGIPGHIAGLKLVISGPYWIVFWGWQVVVGTLIPILLLALPTREKPVYVAIAGALIAAGFFGLRLNIVIPGLAVEEIEGFSRAFVSMRTSSHYFPSLSEWSLTAGIVGLGLLLFALGEWLLPRQMEEEDVCVG